MINIDTMIVGILVCLFSRNKVILKHFQNFEATFEKSSIISTILSNFILNTTNPFLWYSIDFKNWFVNQQELQRENTDPIWTSFRARQSWKIGFIPKP